MEDPIPQNAVSLGNISASIEYFFSIHNAGVYFFRIFDFSSIIRLGIKNSDFSCLRNKFRVVINVI